MREIDVDKSISCYNGVSGHIQQGELEMTIPTADRMSFTSSTDGMKDKILELHSNDWYIESLSPTTDLKVRIVAKKLTEGMRSQLYSDLDMKDFWFRYSQMRDFKVRECTTSGISEK